jgi:predicted transcriptional regulator of viral defense system
MAGEAERELTAPRPLLVRWDLIEAAVMAEAERAESVTLITLCDALDARYTPDELVVAMALLIERGRLERARPGRYSLARKGPNK